MTATPPSVTLASRVTLSDDVLVQEVGGEVVLLDLASERYFGLDEVGTRIWELLPERDDLTAVHRSLCEEFEALPALIEHDLLALVSELSAAGLVRVE
jgi:hypothetical protein